MKLWIHKSILTIIWCYVISYFNIHGNEDKMTISIWIRISGIVATTAPLYMLSSIYPSVYLHFYPMIVDLYQGGTRPTGTIILKQPTQKYHLGKIKSCPAIKGSAGSWWPGYRVTIYVFLSNHIWFLLNLSYSGGGPYVPPFFLFSFY